MNQDKRRQNRTIQGLKAQKTNSFSHKQTDNIFIGQLYETWQTNSKYQKSYFCKNWTQLQIIIARNNLINNHFPSFQILAQANNVVNVNMKKYHFSGLQILCECLEKPALFRSFIVNLSKAFQMLSSLYGNFKLTNQKIRADSTGTIVMWRSEDFQRCFPQKKHIIQPFNEQYITFKTDQYTFGNEIKVLLLKFICDKKIKIDFNILNHVFNDISGNFKPQNHTNCQKQLKPVQNHRRIESYAHIKDDRKKNMRKLIKSDFFTYKISANDHFGQEKSALKPHEQYLERFSIKEDIYERSVKRQTYLFDPLKRMSNYETRNTKIKRVKSPKYFTEKKIPQFIKQRQLAKSQQNSDLLLKTSPNVQPVIEKRDGLDMQTIMDNKTILITIVREQARQQQASLLERPVQKSHNIKQNLFNQGVNLLLKNAKSCKQISGESAFQNMQTQSTIPSVRECSSSKTFFLSNLSHIEQKQLDADFQKIFLSRKINNQEIFEEAENQELKRQLMLLIQ